MSRFLDVTMERLDTIVIKTRVSKDKFKFFDNNATLDTSSPNEVAQAYLGRISGWVP